MVIGNTGVGKSSFVHTLRKYCENLARFWHFFYWPESFLTGDPKNKDYKETKVMDVVKNLKFKKRYVTKAKENTEGDHSKLTIIEVCEKEVKTDIDLNLNITDFGGKSILSFLFSSFISLKLESSNVM